MNRAAPAATGVGTVTVEPVITGCGVSRMRAGSRTVTGVIGTHIPVIGTGRPRRIKTGIARLLAGTVTFRSSRTGVSRVNRAAPAAAGVGTVTVEAVITGCGVSGCAQAPAPSQVSSVHTFPSSVQAVPDVIKTGIARLLAGTVTFRSSRTGVSRVNRAAPAAAGVSTVTVEAVITGCRVSRMRAGPRTVTGVIGTHIAVIGTGRA